MTHYAPFPTAVPDIKRDIALRREAIRIMFAEITALKQHLAKALGPEGFLAWMAEEAAEGADDALGVVRDRQAPTAQDRSGWKLHDYLEKDDEWREYLRKGGWNGVSEGSG